MITEEGDEASGLGEHNPTHSDVVGQIRLDDSEGGVAEEA
jgi:hypothetical protein